MFINIRTAAAALLLFCCALPACAGEREESAARDIGTLIKEELSPEKISVTTSPEGKRAFIECTGARLSGIRVEKLVLDAEFSELPQKTAGSSYPEALSKAVTASRGEIRLLESDVNDYFAKGNSPGGFRQIAFDFTPAACNATGKYEMQLMFFSMEVDLRAKGRLEAKKDGLYLVDTELWAQGLKQPDKIVKEVTGRVNPILNFSKLPFPVELKKAEMTDKEAILTGYPHEKPKASCFWQYP